MTLQDDVEITKFEGEIAPSPGLSQKNKNIMNLKDAATGHDEDKNKIMNHPEVKKRNTAMDFHNPTHYLGQGHL